MNQTTNAGTVGWLSLAAIPLFLLGIFFSPALAACATMMPGAAGYHRNRLLATVWSGFALVFLLFALGYDVGKDRAR